MARMPSGYYDRFNKNNRYEKHLFIAGRPLQSAELNEIQSNAANKIKTVGDAVFKDGQIITDAVVEIDKETGLATCGSGTIYINGIVRDVGQAVIQLPLTGDCIIGIRIEETVITAVEDSNLLDPATGLRNHQKEGADRLKVIAKWATDADGEVDPIYPIYYVTDCEIIRRQARSEIEFSLAQYDRDSAGGTYVTNGMGVTIAEDDADGNQVYFIGSGKARVYGWPVTFFSDKRVIYEPNPTSESVTGESHTAIGGPQRVNIYTKPLAELTQVIVKVERTYEMTRGMMPNTADTLPDNSVVSIVSISGYRSGIDYRLSENKVDWSLGGNEPSTGSTYTVVYQYWKIADVTEVDLSGLFINDNIVAGDGNILINYRYFIPRVDRLCINKDGQIVWVQGLPSRYNPQAGRITEELLSLAIVYQSWDSGRYLMTDGARMVSMSELSKIQAKLDRVLSEVAQNKLILDASMRETAFKKQIFVDSLIDDNMRDEGIEQDAIILNEQLMLNIPVVSEYLSAPPANSLDGSLVVEVEQLLKTGSMKINGYMAYVPDPINATIEPAIDRWTETVIVDENGYYRPRGWAYGKEALRRLVSQLHDVRYVKTVTEVVGTETAEILRQIKISFDLKGLQPNESCSVVFDGITVQTTPSTITADEDGNASGKFTIPANVKSGIKKVDFIGGWGSTGVAYFQGQGTIQNVINTYTISDPLSQTFRVNQKCQLGAVDIWITKLGTTPISIQIRNVENGYPTSEVIAETTINTDSLTVGRFNRFEFEYPVTVSENRDYSITVLCNDSDSEIAIAELGGLDESIHKYVTQQAYQVGVLFSSSNGVTWTAHQNMDMTFRLMRYEYSSNTKAIPLGTVTVEDTTDLMVLGVEDVPDENIRVDYRVDFEDGTSSVVSSDQGVKLPIKKSGEITVTAILYGSSRLSPVIYPDSALVHGCINDSGDYITRAISTYNVSGETVRIRVIYETDTPEGSSCSTFIKGIDEGDVWQSVPQISSVGLNDGWFERTFEIDDVSEDAVHLKLTLAGSTGARPYARNIRFMVM